MTSENDNDHLCTGMQIGDYQLNELLYDGVSTRTWLAHQVSVQREVLIDSLKQEQLSDPDFVETFLSDVKAKAQVEHPLIATVFEATQEPSLCFYAHEHLQPPTLADFLAEAQSLAPESIAQIVRQVAEANLYLEQGEFAQLPIQAQQIHLNETHQCRLVNMAVGGERSAEVATEDKQMLSTLLSQLLTPDLPGSTRIASLLDYMSRDHETALTWLQIHDLSEEVEQQLRSTSTLTSSLEPEQDEAVQKENRSQFLIAISLLIGLGGAIWGFQYWKNKPKLVPARDLSQTVQIPDGSYPNYPTGEPVKLASFTIDAHEVTIAEYAEFLKQISALNPDQLSIYQHPDQPKSKVSHIPDRWDALHTAIEEMTPWDGQLVNVNFPVVGVDFWDAYTYATFHESKLPTQHQWRAAVSIQNRTSSTSQWSAADDTRVDHSNNGIYGLTRNVSEWCGEMAKDPSFPTLPAMPVLLGGSFLKSQAQAESREWLSNSSSDPRNTRRPDLGFRCVR